MARQSELAPEFIELAPHKVKEGVLYVSMVYASAIHRCACGCGQKVVTPLSPTDWKLTFDGESVSLYPSIGNWSFPCQSHYWIDKNKVRWAPRMSKQEIEAVRAADRQAKERYFGSKAAAPAGDGTAPPETLPARIWPAFLRWLRVR